MCIWFRFVAEGFESVKVDGGCGGFVDREWMSLASIVFGFQACNEWMNLFVIYICLRYAMLCFALLCLLWCAIVRHDAWMLLWAFVKLGLDLANPHLVRGWLF